MNLEQLLKSKRFVSVPDQIQLVPAAVPLNLQGAGHEAKVAHNPFGYTDSLMAVGKVGYSVPDPVNFALSPASQIITSTPQTKQTAHITIGGNC